MPNQNAPATFRNSVKKSVSSRTLMHFILCNILCVSVNSLQSEVDIRQCALITQQRQTLSPDGRSEPSGPSGPPFPRHNLSREQRSNRPRVWPLLQRSACEGRQAHPASCLSRWSTAPVAAITLSSHHIQRRST